MIPEINREQYSRLQLILERLPRAAVAGTIAGTTPGRVFADDPQDPQAIFIWNEFHFSYLAGDPSDAEFLDGLLALLESELLPEARRSADSTLVLYPDSAAWIETLEQRLRHYNPLRLFRSLHRFNPGAFEQHARDLGALRAGLELLPIDANLCARFPELGATIKLLWWDVQNFLSHGFGFCLLAGNELASACYTAFCASGWAEIGVETKEAYRRQGLARQLTTALIRESILRGLEPVWECWWENGASRSLAAALGFEWLEDYPVLFIE